MRDRKVADVQKIDAVAAAVGRLPHPQEIVSFPLHRDRDRGVLGEQRMVVAGGDDEALGVEEFEVRIEHLLIEPDGLDHRTDSAAGGQMDPEGVDVFVSQRAPHRLPGRDRLRGFGGIVRLLFLKLIGEMNVEHPQVGQPFGRPQPQPLRSGGAVGRNPQRGCHDVVLAGQCRNADPIRLEEELLWLVELRARDPNLDLGALLPTGRLDPLERRCRDRDAAVANK